MSDVEFAPDDKEPSETVSEKAKKEQVEFEKAKPTPNSIVIKLWGGGHLSFEPDSSVQIFAILALVLLVLATVVTSLLGIWSVHGASWLEKTVTSLGNAISAIVGAMVGSAVSHRSRRK